MDTYVYGLFTLIYILLLIFGLYLIRNFGIKSLSNVLLLITIGLIWDNGLLAIGNWIGEGPTLESLNKVRYWLHAFLTPLLVLFSWDVASRSGVSWARHTMTFWISLLITVALILHELLTVTIGLELVLDEKYGVLHYSNSSHSGAPLIVIVASITLLISSITIFIKLKWKWMLIGIILMTIGSIVPIQLPTDTMTNAFELILMILLWTTKRHLDKNGF